LVNLKNIKLGKNFNYQTLKCSPSLPHDVSYFEFNKSGKYLLAVSPRKCAVIEISQRARLEIARSESEELITQTLWLGERLLAQQPSCQIVKASWHPLSDSHVVVLTSDNTLRIFNVTVNLNEHEQVYRLNESGADKIITFTFGGSKQPSWQHFTIYLMTDAGDIYSLCPVIPYYCIIPSALLTELQDHLQAELDNFDNNFDADELKQKEASLEWLTHVKGAVVASEVTRKSTNKFAFDDDSDEELNSMGGDDEDGASLGENKWTRSGWVRTRPPERTAGLVRPGLVGPLTIVNSTSSLANTAIDLLCLPSTPTTLLRAHSTGMVDTLLNFEENQPYWLPKGYFLDDVEREVPELMLWEKIDLGIAKKIQSSGKQFTTPRLALDPAFKDRFYAFHSAGVHRVNLVWLKDLEKFAFEDMEESEDLPDLGMSEIQYILSNPTGKELLGHVTISHPLIGDLFGLIYQGWVCNWVDQRVVNLGSASLQGLSHATDSLASTPTSSLMQLVAQWQRLQQQSITKVGHGSLSMQSEDSLVYFIKFAQMMQKKYIMFLYQAHEEINTRLRLLQELKDSQEFKLNDASRQLGQIDQKQQELQLKLKRTLEFQANLTARASTVLQVVNTSQHKLSKAETDYLGELREMRRAEDFYSDKIDELKKRATTVKDGNKALPQIAPAQLDKIKPIIEDEHAMIEQAISDLQGLQIKAESLL
jgi:hypothetical protein